MNPSFLFLPKCSSQTNKSCPGRRGGGLEEGTSTCMSDFAIWATTIWTTTIFGALLFLGCYFYWIIWDFFGTSTQQSKYVQNFIIKALPSQDNPTCNFIFFIDVVEFRMMLFNFLSQKRGGGKFSWLPRVCLVLLRRSQGRRSTASEFFIQPSGFSQMCVSAHFCAFTDALNSDKIRETSQRNCQKLHYCKY